MIDLDLHPAFKETIPLPVAVLFYQELGLGFGEVMYLIHILHAQLSGQTTIDRSQIAMIMGVNPGTISRYNRQLENKGILTRTEQYSDGQQIGNRYDLNRWLTLAMDARRKHSDMDRLLGQLQEIEDIGELRRLLAEYQDPPLILRSSPPLDPTINPPLDPTINPPTTGSPLDPTIKGSIDDDDQFIRSTSETDQTSSQAAQTPVDALLSLRGHNGSQLSRITANQIAYKAMQRYQDHAAAIFGWVVYAKANPKIKNAPGFVRVKLEAGELPPEDAPEDAPAGGDYMDRLPPDIRSIIQH